MTVWACIAVLILVNVCIFAAYGSAGREGGVSAGLHLLFFLIPFIIFVGLVVLVRRRIAQASAASELEAPQQRAAAGYGPEGAGPPPRVTRFIVHDARRTGPASAASAVPLRVLV